MTEIRVLGRHEIGRRGKSYMLIVRSCCPDRRGLGLYARISQEDKEREKYGIDRQFAIGFDAAHREGFCISRIYVDDDITAAKINVRRPGWLCFLEDLKNHVIHGAAVQHQDRLYRLDGDLFQFRSLHNPPRFRVELVTKNDRYDLSSNKDLLVLQFGTIIGEQEVKSGSRRVSDMHAGRAAIGARTGGNRAFGWNATPDAYRQLALVADRIRDYSLDAFDILVLKGDRKAANRMAEEDLALLAMLEEYNAALTRVRHEYRKYKCPIESGLLRTARKQLLEGKKRNAIVVEWNQLGYRGTRGAPWSVNSLTDVITSPLLAGWRMHKGKIARDRNGNRVRGTQEPIFSQKEHEEIASLLDRLPPELDSDEAPQGVVLPIKPAHGNRKHLLGGLLACGGCNAGHLHGNSANKAKNAQRPGEPTKTRKYSCDNAKMGCRVSIDADFADMAILRLVGQRVAQLPLVQATDETDTATKHWPKQTELAAKEKSRDFWATRMAEPDADLVFAYAQIQQLEGKIKDLRAERQKWLAKFEAERRPPELPSIISLDDLPETDRQRMILEKYLETVVVMPSKNLRNDRGHPIHDPSRLVPIWRQRAAHGSPALLRL